jgi:N-succinyldiaminopimelate aminotransferase
MSNSRLQQLDDYPFARLNALLAEVQPPAGKEVILASVGEPRLPLPDFVAPLLAEQCAGFSKYPPSTGTLPLRQAVADWLQRRYHIPALDAATQVLSANGTREALFGIAHALVDPEASSRPWVLMPNPMYQIYNGAAITAGARAYPLPCTAASGFAPDLDAVPVTVWRNTALIYLCSPGNPTGWVADAAYYQRLLALADEYDFCIVSDECYSEIYADQPPVGLLQVAAAQGRTDYRHCIVMNSLSKRSALPGLRSGFIAGDASVIATYLKLRSYSGPATPLPLQAVATHAWQDEAHVQQNLAIYQQSLRAFADAYGQDDLPAGSFFIWLPVSDGEAFAKRAWSEQAVRLLPGAYLAVHGMDGSNPGQSYVRIALVDGAAKAAELGQRLRLISE